VIQQTIQGGVKQLAAGDIHNHPGSGRALTRAERIDLNRQVDELENQSGDSRREIWLELHRLIGVNSIDEMCIEHLAAASALLELRLQNATLRKELAAISAPAVGAIAANDAFVTERRQLMSDLRKLRQERNALRDQLDDVSARLGTLQTESERQARMLNNAYELDARHKAEQARLKTKLRWWRGSFVLLLVMAVGAGYSLPLFTKDGPPAVSSQARAAARR
jgi:hypothetical protein